MSDAEIVEVGNGERELVDERRAELIREVVAVAEGAEVAVDRAARAVLEHSWRVARIEPASVSNETASRAWWHARWLARWARAPCVAWVTSWSSIRLAMWAWAEG